MERELWPGLDRWVIPTSRLSFMAPAKKQKKATAQPTLSPKDAHFARLKKAIDDHRCKGSMLIVGVGSGESSDESGDEDDSKEYTAAEMTKLRHILINDSRDKALKKSQQFTTGGRRMFGTSDGNRICTGIPGEIKKAMQQKSVPARFDHLFALTYALQSFEFWMHDNECWEPGQELEKAIKALAKAWRDMLKRSNEELGIDGEFTRPGVEALLSQLEGDFEGCEASEDYEFKWRA